MKKYDVYNRAHESFPHFNEKYKCCCSSIHVREGAKLIGVINAVFGLLTTFFSSGDFASSNESNPIRIAELVVNVTNLLCALLVVVGTKKFNARYLVPYIIFNTFHMIAMVVVLLLIGYSILYTNSSFAESLYNGAQFKTALEIGRKSFDRQGIITEELAIHIVNGFMAMITLISFIVSSWFLSVVYRCHRYLKDYEYFTKSYGSVVFVP